MPVRATVKRGRTASKPTAIGADLRIWLVDPNDLMMKFNRALHDLEYEGLTQGFVERFYTVEEVSARAGVNPKSVAYYIDEYKEELGIEVRRCRKRSSIGLCVRHKPPALRNGPYGEAWAFYAELKLSRGILRKCQYVKCYHDREFIEALVRKILYAPQVLGVDPERLEEWLGIDMNRIKEKYGVDVTNLSV